MTREGYRLFLVASVSHTPRMKKKGYLHSHIVEAKDNIAARHEAQKQLENMHGTPLRIQWDVIDITAAVVTYFKGVEKANAKSKVSAKSTGFNTSNAGKSK